MINVQNKQTKNKNKNQKKAAMRNEKRGKTWQI